jgi:hypothetical protein
VAITRESEPDCKAHLMVFFTIGTIHIVLTRIWMHDQVGECVADCKPVGFA